MERPTHTFEKSTKIKVASPREDSLELTSSDDAEDLKVQILEMDAKLGNAKGTGLDQLDDEHEAQAETYHRLGLFPVRDASVV